MNIQKSPTQCALKFQLLRLIQAFCDRDDVCVSGVSGVYGSESNVANQRCLVSSAEMARLHTHTHTHTHTHSHSHTNQWSACKSGDGEGLMSKVTKVCVMCDV